MPQPKDEQPELRFATIALGSNANSCWGDAAQTIQKASLELEKRLGATGDCSPFYGTPAFPEGAGPDFVNAVIRIAVTLPAADLLCVLHEIEAEVGRERVVRWGQRTLDLDLIALGELVAPDQQEVMRWIDLDPEKQMEIAPEHLILPHPRVQDRSFVLVPMADVDPDWVHPVLGLTTCQMRDARPPAEIASVQRL